MQLLAVYLRGGKTRPQEDVYENIPGTQLLKTNPVPNNTGMEKLNVVTEVMAHGSRSQQSM